MEIKLTTRQINQAKTKTGCEHCGKYVNMSFDKGWALFANILINDKTLSGVVLLCNFCAERVGKALVKAKEGVKKCK